MHCKHVFQEESTLPVPDEDLMTLDIAVNQHMADFKQQTMMMQSSFNGMLSRNALSHGE
jgi:hypothetical protein